MGKASPSTCRCQVRCYQQSASEVWAQPRAVSELLCMCLCLARHHRLDQFARQMVDDVVRSAAGCSQAWAVCGFCCCCTNDRCGELAVLTGQSVHQDQSGWCAGDSGDAALMATFDELVALAARRFQPDIILVSCHIL